MFPVIISLLMSSILFFAIVSTQSTPVIPQFHSSSGAPQVYDKMSKLSMYTSLELTTENCPLIWQSSLVGRYEAMMKNLDAHAIAASASKTNDWSKEHEDSVIAEPEGDARFHTHCCLPASSPNCGGRGASACLGIMVVACE